MKTIRLGDLAAIDISNVDKKAKAEEISVTLCNFVDVYHNWIIDGSNARSLMQATARQTQIERFSLRHGQVAITKDSETRDDIGIPTFIDKVPDKTVLGYHCALITPIDNMLDGAYLNCVLQTDYAKKYFECNASGSGQRYTLTVEVISDFPVPLPPLDEQIKRAEIFTVIHRALSNSQSICSDLEATAKLLYDYWFVQFDFPDESGKPYKSSGGKMVWNDELKREIPAGWSCVQLGRIAEYVGDSISNNLLGSNSYISTDNMVSNRGGIVQSQFVPKIGSSTRFRPGDVLLSNIRPYFKKIWCADRIGGCCNDVLVLRPTLRDYAMLCYWTMRSDSFFAYDMAGSKGSKMPRGDKNHILQYPVALPPKNKKIAADFDKIANLVEINVSQLRANDSQLVKLRDFLLPLLMNGQVTIGDDGK